jgi:hypothetical protein
MTGASLTINVILIQKAAVSNGGLPFFKRIRIDSPSFPVPMDCLSLSRPGAAYQWD